LRLLWQLNSLPLGWKYAAVNPIVQTSSPKLAFLQTALAEQGDRQRCLVEAEPQPGGMVQRQGRRLINFSSNDYLGLAHHPQVIAGASAAVDRYGAGATASRLVCGTLPLHQAVEEQLAAFVGREAALLFNSGYQANATLLPTLLDRHSLVLADRLIHNSLLHGIRLSGAKLLRYPHNDLDQLAALLRKSADQYPRLAIVSETVFSMDGDRADLDGLATLADRYGAMLYLDDAHALGVLGPQGAGLAALHPGVDLVIGTFGKACGSFGAFVAGSAMLRDYLINFCPGLIYSTALPPAVLGAIHAALQLLPTLEAQRHHLQRLADTLSTQVQRLGFDTLGSSSQIVPLVVGSNERALSLSSWLEQQGILGIAIRPPTVPVGTARLRLALSAVHQTEHIRQCVMALEAWQDAS
jgi:8-amino-7-oxononanoate synthase